MLLERRWLGNIGTDPELFVFSGRKLIPAFKFLKSKNECKWRTGAETAIYWDGFQAEFKFRRSNQCLVIFVQDIQCALKLLLKDARKFDKNAHLSIQNVVKIDKEELESAHNVHVELGCEPCFNAYNLGGEPVSNPRNLPWRFSGGHMHFSPITRRPPIPTIKRLDSILGIWAVGAAQAIDIPIRRQFYGLPGEFRLPTYAPTYVGASKVHGLEYRTLSNFWLCHPRITMLTWEIACRVITVPTKFNGWMTTEQEVVETIKNCDVDQAKKILKRNVGVFMDLLPSNWSKTLKQESLNVALSGVESVCNPQEVGKNWELHTSNWTYHNVPCWRNDAN